MDYAERREHGTLSEWQWSEKIGRGGGSEETCSARLDTGIEIGGILDTATGPLMSQASSDQTGQEGW